MIDERKEPELDKVAALYELVNGRVEEMVDTGLKASRKSYLVGKLEVYQRMLQNLNQVEDGIDTFFMGSLWKDIKQKEELKDRSLRDEENGEDSSKDACKEIETKYCLNFLKKRARPNTDSSEDLRQIEMLPGGTLKPIKKTQ